MNYPEPPLRRVTGAEEASRDRYGEGAVELDALEALHPGVLGRIVRDAIAPYRDRTLQARLSEAEAEAQEIAEAEWQSVQEEFEPALDAIKRDAEAIISNYRGKLEALAAGLENDLAPLADRLRVVQHAVQDAAVSFMPELPERPAPEIEELDEEDWLYDSGRSYPEQLRVYKLRKSNE